MMKIQTVNRSGWMRLGVSLLILVGLFLTVDLSILASYFRQVDLSKMIFACCWLTLTIITFASRWWYILHKMGLSVGYSQALKSYFAGELINQVMPGGVAGEIYRGIHHRQIGLAKLSSSIFIDRAYGVATLTLTAAIALGPMALSNQFPVLLSVLIFLSVIGLVIMVKHTDWPVETGLDRLTFGDHLIAGIYSAIGLGLIIVGFITIAVGVGVEMNFLTLSRISIIMMLASLLPFSFGDWGIREGALAGLWVAFGQPPGQGIAIGILFGMANVIASLPGIFHFWRQERT
jgi:uncharacterized membrane protein YbhN (UPF0104 family)